MPDEKLTKAHEIATRARGLPEAERGPYLDETCGGDAELRIVTEAVLFRLLDGVPPVRPPGVVTELLQAAAQGDASAMDRLWVAVYEDLRHHAGRLLHQETRKGALPSTTSLVNRSYLRLFGKGPVDFKNRRYFFGAATLAMQRIIIEIIRAGVMPSGAESLASVVEQFGFRSEDIERVSAALRRLGEDDERKAEIVRLRLFAGQRVEDVARYLGISERLVKQESRFALARLRSELREREAA